MAIAERFLRNNFGSELCDHHTFVFAGDGDLSEGLSHEAASLAGHLGLGRLICVYDDNHITIDGPTELALSDDAAARFRAYDWDVVELGEAANDVDALTEALEAAKADESKPTLITLRSHIGYPSPELTDHHSAHGKPVRRRRDRRHQGGDGSPARRAVLDSARGPPDVSRGRCPRRGPSGPPGRSASTPRPMRTGGPRPGASGHPEAASAALAAADGFEPGGKIATRKASQTVLTAVADALPTVIGGAADLTGQPPVPTSARPSSRRPTGTDARSTSA